MKKLLVVFMMLFVLSSCEQPEQEDPKDDPITCEEGQVLVEEECISIEDYCEDNYEVQECNDLRLEETDIETEALFGFSAIFIGYAMEEVESTCEGTFIDPEICETELMPFINDHIFMMGEDIVSTKIDNDTVEISIDNMLGNGRFVFTFDLTITEEFGTMFTDATALWDNEYPYISKTDFLDQYEEILEYSRGRHLQCENYFSEGAEEACIQFEDYTDTFRFEYNEEYVYQTGNETFMVLVESSIRPEYTGILEFTMMETDDQPIFVEALIDFEGPSYSEDMILDQILIADSDGEDICEFIHFEEYQECVTFFSFIEFSNIEHDVFPNTNIFRFYENDVLYELEFTYIPTLDENLEYHFDLYVVDYTNPVSAATSSDLSLILLEVFGNPQNHVDNCANFIAEDNSSLRLSCQVNGEFFSAYTTDNYSDEVFSDNVFKVLKPSDDGEFLEIIYITLVFEGTWKIDDYQKSEKELINLVEADEYIDQLFIEFNQINQYEYCYMLTPLGWDKLSNECINDFLYHKTNNVKAEVVSIEAGLALEEYIVTYKEYNHLVTYEVTASVTFGEKFNTDEIFMIVEELSRTEMHEFTPVYSLYVNHFNDYTTMYLDETVDSQTVYDTFVNPMYDYNEFASQRAQDLVNIDTIVFEDIQYPINNLSQIVIRLRYQINFSDGNSMFVNTYNPVNNTDTALYAPLYGNISYTLDSSLGTAFIENAIDAGIHPYITRFICEDVFTTNYGCLDPIHENFSVFGQQYEISFKEGNTYTVVFGDVPEVQTTFEYTLELENGVIQISNITEIQ